MGKFDFSFLQDDLKWSHLWDGDWRKVSLSVTIQSITRILHYILPLGKSF